MGQTSGSNTGSLELLQRIEKQQLEITKLKEELQFTSIKVSDFFEAEETVEILEMEAVKSGKTISIYGKIKFLSELENNKIGTIKIPYRTNLTESIGSMRSAISPFAEEGSIWFSKFGVVRVWGYGVQRVYYISASWSC